MESKSPRPHPLPSSFESKYMSVNEEEITLSESGRTYIIPVRSKKGGALLCTISWYGPWNGYQRRYGPLSENEVIWISNGCSRDLDAYIKKLMELWRTRRRKN